MRLDCAGVTLADHSPGTFEALKRKHPTAHPNSHFDPSPNPTMFTDNINEQDVRKAIVSFPNLSAEGLNGFRPQHLRDLTGPSAMEGVNFSLVPCVHLFLLF